MAANVSQHMSRSTSVIVTLAVGAALGMLVGEAISASARLWYGTAASPIILLLAPGALVALFNPVDPYVYKVGFVLIQITCYSAIAFGVRALIKHAKRNRNAG